MSTNTITGWLSSLERELIEMDAAATAAQIGLWSEFSRYPDFPALGQEIFKGWAEHRYMDWQNIELSLHLKPVKPGVSERMKEAWRSLFKGKEVIVDEKNQQYVMVEASEASISLKIQFSKKNGKLSVTHQMEKAN